MDRRLAQRNLISGLLTAALALGALALIFFAAILYIG
jgi:hypothetical protein